MRIPNVSAFKLGVVSDSQMFCRKHYEGVVIPMPSNNKVRVLPRRRGVIVTIIVNRTVLRFRRNR